MKRKFLSMTAMALMVISGGTLVFIKENVPCMKAVAEEAKDMSGIFEWKASAGNFIEIEDWFYSGKGFSYEFKLKDPDATKINETIITLMSGTTDITDIKDLATGNYRSHSFAKKTYGGEIGFMVPLGDDWYRYELMLADLNPFIKASSSKHAKIDGLKWNWGAGYYNDCYMKNMKVIDHYSADAFTFTTQSTNFQITVKSPTNNPGSQGGLSPIESWKSSGKGFSLEFENKRSKQEIVYNLTATDGTSLTANYRMVIPAGTLGTNPGKLFSLGNDWYRFELLFEDIDAKADTDTKEFGVVNVIWVPEGYGPSIYRNVKHIDAYTCEVTFDDGTTVNKVTVQGKLEKPEDPVAPNGKHFSAWLKGSLSGEPWDFDEKVSVDMTLYAKFEDHLYSYQFDDEEHWEECSCGDEKAGSREEHSLEEVVNDDYMVYPATCSHPATYYKSCECGYVSDTETFQKGELDPSNHLWAESPTVENFVAPTCEEEGGYDDVIRCTECNTISSSVHHTLPKIGHDYEAKDWQLSEDKTTATVKLICVNDETHVINKTATVRMDRVEPTYEKEGLVIYTLVAVHEGKSYSTTITESIPKKEEPKPAPVDQGGCGGSIMASTVLLSTISLVGISIVLTKKRKKGE